MSASIAGASSAAVGPAAAPPAPRLSPSTHKLATLSASELRTGMQQHFRVNGTLQQLKTQLRGMMLTDLLEQPRTARMLVGGAAQSIPLSASSSSSAAPGQLEDRAAALHALSAPPEAAAEPTGGRAVAVLSRRTDQTLQTWSCGLADALVENHLRRTRRAMSLSIFSTEAEVPPFTTGGAPSEEEAYLAHLFRQTSGDASPSASSPAAAEEDDFLSVSPSRSMKSVLQRLVEDCVTREGLLSGSGAAPARHRHSCSTQTDAADSTDGATNPLNSLECRLAAVDAKYALTFSQLRRVSVAGEESQQRQPFFLRSEVERRLAQYKSDMHAQLRSEYEQKYNAFTRVQLQEARDAAEQRYRMLARTKAEEFAEMERSVTVKMEQERERLKLSWEDVHQQRTEMERRQRDMARQLEIQEAAQEEKEEELQKVRETCRALRLQCAKWEELCATRLMELDGARSREERRMEDLRRLQAEHAAELRLKDEEVSRLRYRVRLLTREVEVPTTVAAPSAADESAATGTAAADGAAPVDSKQLYGLLLRTEEMQRNALVQQQQQQQRWDAAWVAAAGASAAVTNAGTAPAASPSASSTARKPATLLANQPPPSPQPPAVEGTQTRSGGAGAASPRPTADRSSAYNAVVVGAAASPAPAVPPTAAPNVLASPLTPAAAGLAASPSLSSVSAASKNSKGSNQSSRLKEASSGAAVAAPPASHPSSPPAATSLAAAAPPSATSRQSSTSTARTATTTTTTSPTASSIALRKQPSAKTSSVGSTPTSKSSSTSPSATPKETLDKDAAASPDTASTTTALQKTEDAEDESRNAIATEEDTARSGIVWSEKNARDIVEETLRQAHSSHGNDDGGLTRPWERTGASPGAATMAPMTGGGTIFDDSFSTDDDALLPKSTDDDSDF